MIRSGKEKGFSLIEAMVAMVIVSVALLGMGALTISVVRSGNTAKLRTVAMHVAEQKLEQWYDGTAPSQTDTVSVDNTTFYLQSFDSTPISGVTSSSNMYNITNGTPTNAHAITVYWQDSAGTHNVTVTDMDRVTN